MISSQTIPVTFNGQVMTFGGQTVKGTFSKPYPEHTCVSPITAVRFDGEVISTFNTSNPYTAIGDGSAVFSTSVNSIYPANIRYIKSLDMSYTTSLVAFQTYTSQYAELTSLYLRSSRVSPAYPMSGYSGLVNVDMASATITYSNYMSSLFMGDTALTGVDMSCLTYEHDRWNTARTGSQCLKVFRNTFSGCSSLISFKGFDSLSGVQYLNGTPYPALSAVKMFYGCGKLTGSIQDFLDQIGYDPATNLPFDSTSMSGMFYGCTSLSDYEKFNGTLFTRA